MAKETVEMVAAGYEWICPECDRENTEPTIPVIGNSIGELICQGCKTTFNCGVCRHAYAD